MAKKKSTTPSELFILIPAGSEQAIRAALAREGDANPRDRMKRTPLMYAALQGTQAQAQLLLDSGADVNARDRAGFTALHFAAQENRKEIAELLIRRQADVNAQNEYGNSPLWVAAFSSRGQGEVIRLLRGAGADPDLANKSGVSPRQLAQDIGNYNVKQFFE